MTLSDEDRARPFVEVSGRRGYGVKADDLLDRLTSAAQAEVDARHPELTDRRNGPQIANQIAVGALRYFMLRYTRNTVIAFDFKDALSFEGETGPYVQYAIVRAANIFRKAGVTEEAALAGRGRARPVLARQRRRDQPVGDVAARRAPEPAD
jgi:arginyl-tRNA synthetase